MPRQTTIQRLHRRRNWAVAALLTVGLVVAWAHEGHAPLPSKGATVDLAKGTVLLSRQARDALNLKTAVAAPKTLDDALLAYVTLVPPWGKQAFGSARLPGRIVAIHAQPGDAVAANQKVAEVDSPELADLQSEIISAKTAAELSARIAEQTEKLGREGAIPQREWLEAQSRHLENQNALALARAKWLALGFSLAEFERLLVAGQPIIKTLPISAPIAGRLMHVDLTLGRVVEATEHLFEVLDADVVWSRIAVLERDLHRVERGQTVEMRFTALPQESFTAVLEEKSQAFDSSTRLGVVWSTLRNPAGAPRLLPGMVGQAWIRLAQPKPLLAVPEAALQCDGAEHYVLVEEETTERGDQYRKRAVVPGRRSGGWVQIQSGGIYPGDRVVVQGSHELAPFFVRGVLRLSTEAERNLGLAVEPVQRRVLDQIVFADGIVDVPAAQRSSVSAPVSGTLRSLGVVRGQTVAAGMVLGELVSLEFLNVQLELLRAHFQLQLVEKTLALWRSVAADAVLARRLVWEAESQASLLRTRKDSLQRKLETLGLLPAQLGELLLRQNLVPTLPIRAPAQGVLVDFTKALGQSVRADEPLFEVHDLKTAFIQTYLAERDALEVRVGQAARFTLVADPRLAGTGRIVRIGQSLDSESRTLGAWIEVAPPTQAEWRHGMMVRAAIVLRKFEAALAVPWSAVLHDGPRRFVFVRLADGTYERRAVTLGRGDDRFAEIAAGLKEGEVIAVKGVADLQTAYATIR